MPIDVLVLNFNGRRLLAECLPSVLRAAEASRHDCRVRVVDNDSCDDSLAWLGEHYPQVPVIRCRNQGLASFNEVLPRLAGPVAVLLNNDIKLAIDSLDPLIEPLLDRSSKCFLTASLCWRADGGGYDGQKTAVRWRYGLVQATSLYEGHEGQIHRGGWTASAGAAIAVDRRRFVQLGGFDPLYFPGRIEDLDFAYRGYQAGWHARYVPESIAWHLACATFGSALGPHASDRLALRNTLLFQWKHLRSPEHLARQLVGLPLRLLRDVMRAPWVRREERFVLCRALGAALLRVNRIGRQQARASAKHERGYFARFHPAAIDREAIAGAAR